MRSRVAVVNGQRIEYRLAFLDDPLDFVIVHAQLAEEEAYAELGSVFPGILVGIVCRSQEKGIRHSQLGRYEKIELTVVNALDALVVDHALVIVFHGVEGRERGQALGGDIEQEAPEFIIFEVALPHMEVLDGHERGLIVGFAAHLLDIYFVLGLVFRIDDRCDVPFAAEMVSDTSRRDVCLLADIVVCGVCIALTVEQLLAHVDNQVLLFLARFELDHTNLHPSSMRDTLSPIAT